MKRDPSYDALNREREEAFADAARWRARTHAAEAEVARLREALQQIADTSASPNSRDTARAALDTLVETYEGRIDVLADRCARWEGKWQAAEAERDKLEVKARVLEEELRRERRKRRREGGW